jgi:hypothetical protein
MVVVSWPSPGVTRASSGASLSLQPSPKTFTPIKQSLWYLLLVRWGNGRDSVGEGAREATLEAFLNSYEGLGLRIQRDRVLLRGHSPNN